MKNFLALLLFLGGMSGWYLHHQHREAESSLASAKQQWMELEKVASTRRTEFKAANAVMSIKEQIKTKKAELKKLQDEAASLEISRQQVISQKNSLILSLRQKFVGRDVSLTLTSGRNLGQVKILKIEDSGLSVATTSGVVKVSPAELSPEIRSALFLSR